MFPLINKQETGVNLRRIMDMRGIAPKDVQEYLGPLDRWRKYADH